MIKVIGISALALAASLASSVPVAAQSREYCTGLCGGRPGGESANPPSVVACFRKCMGEPGTSGDQSKNRKAK